MRSPGEEVPLESWLRDALAGEQSYHARQMADLEERYRANLTTWPLAQTHAVTVLGLLFAGSLSLVALLIPTGILPAGGAILPILALTLSAVGWCWRSPAINPHRGQERAAHAHQTALAKESARHQAALARLEVWTAQAALPEEPRQNVSPDPVQPDAAP